MGALLTPQLVRQLADSLGATSAPEWSLAFALASITLPAGWATITSDDGLVSYVHDSGLVPPQTEHPLLPSAQRALTRLREQQAAQPSSPSSSDPLKLLGPFEDFDSPGTELFYLNVLTGERVPEAECPPELIIPPLPEELRAMLRMEDIDLDADGDAGNVDEEKGQRGMAQQVASASGGQSEAGGPEASPSAGQAATGTASRPGSAAAAMATAAPEPAPTPSGGGGSSGGDDGAGYGREAGAAEAAGPGPGSRPASAAAAPRPTSRRASAQQQAQAAQAALQGLALGSLDPGPSAGGDITSTSGDGDGVDAAPDAPTAATASPFSRRPTTDSVGVGGGDAAMSLPSRSATGEDTVMIGSTSSVVAEASREIGSSALSDLSTPPPLAAPTVAAAVAAAMPPASRPTSSASPSLRPTSAAAGSGSRVALVEPEASHSSSADGGAGGGRDGSGGGGGRGGSGGGGGGLASGARSLAGGGGAGGGSLSGGGAATATGRSRATSAVSGRSVGGGSPGGGGSVVSGSGSASISGDARGPAPPASGRLTFFGWWFEDIESSDLTFRIDCKQTAGGGLAPRHCSLSFDLATCCFTFTARDPVTPPAPGQPPDRVPELTVRGIPPEQVTLCSTGRPADAWDLHLGARLSVLGRPLVLKNAELATAQWHAAHRSRLAAMREKLCVELQKYRPRVLRPGLVRDKGSPSLQTGSALRHLAAQVRELAEELRSYRPAKAEGFLQALPVLL